MNRGISTTGPPDLGGTTSVAGLFLYARRHDMGLSISSCPKFEKMAGLIDVLGVVYTVRGPDLDWYMEKIDRLEEMAGMKELRGRPQRWGLGGTVSGQAGPGGRQAHEGVTYRSGADEAVRRSGRPAGTPVAPGI